LAQILYVETNFVIGIAKGQDPDGAAFLGDAFHDVELIVPSVCFMEALSTWTFEAKQRKKFLTELEAYKREVDRDVSFRAEGPPVKQLGEQCEALRLGSESYLNFVEARLYEALDQLVDLAQKLHPDDDMLREALSHDHIDDPTDNLIYCCVLRHARLNPDPEGRKAFLSGNHKDFRKPEVVQPLDLAGVRYFSQTKDALGWLRS
jgi:hypothetical protein